MKIARTLGIISIICLMGEFLFGLLLGVYAFAEPAEGTKAGSTLRICLAAAADYSPVYPSQTLPSGSKEVIAVFRLGKGELYKNMTATWIAVDVGNVAPPNYKIVKSSLQLRGKDRGKFSYSQPKPLPVGKYRLDVEADGRPWKSAKFTVPPLSKTVDMKQPQDLLPLTKGRVWTYAFVQEAGKGAKISLPGVKLDSDGKLRAKVTFTVAGTDDAGTRIKLHRNAVLVFEEWWRLGEQGLVATKRKKDDKETVLDPPQVLLAQPIKAPQTWRYEAKDKSFKQKYRMWGPIPVQWPGGGAPGYVVMVQEPPQSPRVTVERHFMPGVGLVREVLIMALGGKMLSRQEMVLTSHGQKKQ